MADLDKLRSLLVLLREFGVTKYSEPAQPGVNFSPSEPLVIELGAPTANRNEAVKPEPVDPAVATVRRLQEALRPSALDEGVGVG